jgi:RNA polymerase sigma-70 factor (ECF subfamily)
VTTARPLEEHLFRRESARMIAALTRLFGVHRLELAEDVVQDALCRAMETWKAQGVPENPSAWLMATAKHRALDQLRRERTARTFAPDLGRALDGQRDLAPLLDEAFSASIIRDEQLAMMFSCCQPRLPEEAQLALILNVLCGFAAPEIAAALLTGRAAIEKRISRGKKTLAEAQRLFDLTSSDFDARLETVRRALYLLFNEGYHGASSHGAVRAELCEEALRLTELLRELPAADTPATRALAALMYLHAARLPARVDERGDFFGLADQDRSRWDARLVQAGLAAFEGSAGGETLGRYQLEAAIAATHAAAPSAQATDWALIVALYERLMSVAPSPVVALNRAIAIGERDGAERGLQALESIEGRERLASYPFYAAALGELELRRGARDKARRHFENALGLSRSDAERRFLERRLARALPD